MSHERALPDEVKKIRFLNRLVIAIAGKAGKDQKLIIKDLSKSNKHLTIKAEGQTLDIHETVEGREKRYKSLTKFDFGSIDSDKGASPREVRVRDLVARFNLQEIDVYAPEFADLKAYLPQARMTYKTVKKKEASISDQESLPYCRLSELPSNGYTYVMVGKGENFEFVIMRMLGKYYKFTFETTAQMLYSFMPEATKRLMKQCGMTEKEIKKLLKDA